MKKTTSVILSFYDRKRFIGNAIFDSIPQKTEEEWEDFIRKEFPKATRTVIMARID